MGMLNSPLFTSCATALVTPFLPNHTIDTGAIHKLVNLQIEAGIDALVVLGTTGEPCTISMPERETVILAAMDAAQNRIPIIVGTGANDTKKAIEYAQQAKDLSAQGQLCVTPYYNKATPNGLLQHFGAILDSCDLPMILYNVPGRTGMSMPIDTVANLGKHHNVAGIKEASGNPIYAMEILEKTNGNLPVYCGNDDLILPLMALGARGAISVCSNVVPMQTVQLAKACLSGTLDRARDIQFALMPLIRALFLQVNPIPVKAALSMMDLIHEELRLPLTPMEEPCRSKLRAVLRQMKLIP